MATQDLRSQGRLGVKQTTTHTKYQQQQQCQVSEMEINGCEQSWVYWNFLSCV